MAEITGYQLIYGSDKKDEVYPCHVSFLHDDLQFCYTWKNGIRIYSVETGAIITSANLSSTIAYSTCVGAKQILAILNDTNNATQCIAEINAENLKVVKTFGEMDLEQDMSNQMCSLAISPKSSSDDTIIATSTTDRNGQGQIKIWSTKTGKLQSQIATGSMFLNSISFSASGDLIAGACDNLDTNKKSAVSMWDVVSGKIVYEFVDHVWAPELVRFSPDASQFYTSSSLEDSFRIWTLPSKSSTTADEQRTSHSIMTVDEPAAIVDFGFNAEASIWSSQGDKLIASAASNEITVWSSKTQKRESYFVHVPSEVESASTRKNTIAFLIEADETGSIKKSALGMTTSLANGTAKPSLLLSADENGNVFAWYLSDSKPRDQEKAHRLPIFGLSFSRLDKNVVMSASNDATIRLWSVETGENIATLTDHEKGVNHFSFMPDDPSRFIACDDNGSIYLWSTSTKQSKKLLQMDDGTRIHEAMFAPNAILGSSTDNYFIAYRAVNSEQRFSKVTLCSIRKDLLEIDNSNSLEMETIQLEDAHQIGFVLEFAFSLPTGKYLAVSHKTDDRDGELVVWSMATKSVTHRLTHPRRDGIFWCIRFSPHNEEEICGVDEEGVVLFWSLKTRKISKTLQDTSGDSSVVNCISYSRKDPNIFIVAHDNRVNIWSTKENKIMNSLYNLPDVSSIAFPFDDNGEKMACATENCSIYIIATYSAHVLIKLGPTVDRLPKSFQDFANSFSYAKQKRALVDDFNQFVETSWNHTTEYRFSVVSDKYFSISVIPSQRQQNYTKTLTKHLQVALIPCRTSGTFLRKIFQNLDNAFDLSIPMDDEQLQTAAKSELIRFCVEDCAERNHQNIYAIFRGLVAANNFQFITTFFECLPKVDTYYDATVFGGLLPFTFKRFPALATNGEKNSSVSMPEKKFTFRKYLEDGQESGGKFSWKFSKSNAVIVNHLDDCIWDDIIKQQNFNIVSAYFDYLEENREFLKWNLRNDSTTLTVIFKHLSEITQQPAYLIAKLMRVLYLLESRLWCMEDSHRFTFPMKADKFFYVPITDASNQIDFSIDSAMETLERRYLKSWGSGTAWWVMLKKCTSALINLFSFKKKKVVRITDEEQLDDDSSSVLTSSSTTTTSTKRKQRIRDLTGSAQEIQVVPCVIPIENFYGNTFVQFIASAQDLDYYRNELVQRVLDFKWEAYGRMFYGFYLTAYCLWAFSFLFIHYGFIGNESVTFTLTNSSSDNIAALIILLFFLIGAAGFISLELKQLKSASADIYFTSSFSSKNLHDWITFLSTVALTLIRIGMSKFGYWNYTAEDGTDGTLSNTTLGVSIALAFCCVTVFLKFFNFLKAFRSVGPYIRMTLAITNNIKWLLFLLVFVCFAFVQTFLSVVHPSKMKSINDAMSLEGATLLQSYMMLIGQQGLEDLQTNLGGNETLIRTIYMLFTAVVIILFLNLLISIMAAATDQVNENAIQETYRALGEALAEVETNLVFSFGNKEYFPRFIGYLIPFERYIEHRGDLGGKGSKADTSDYMAKLESQLQSIVREIESLKRGTDSSSATKSKLLGGSRLAVGRK